MFACADVSTHVRTRAAHDFGCSEQATQIVDAAAGVYRIEGCGFAASYHCSDGAGGVTTDCRRLYLSKAADAQVAPKAAPGPGLAKTR
jgi:hypothetical protein